MRWNHIQTISQIADIDRESNSSAILIFKHSTRCSISSTALSRLERNWKETDSERLKPFYLDLLNHRDVSNQLAENYHIEHQSPQVLIIKDGTCIYSASHFDIQYQELLSKI